MSNLPQKHWNRLARQLMRHEGAKRDKEGRHIPYRCTAGALTIGYGHNLDAHPLPGVGTESRLSEEEAERLLAADMELQESHLRASFPFVKNLDPVRYAVLVNMCFNLGIGRLRTFRNTLADIEAGNYTGAARRMLRSRWAGQVGRRAVELARQMETGVWI